MTRHQEIAGLRVQLREVNIEYSALVRTKGDKNRFVRMDELKVRRQVLMSLIAKRQNTTRAAIHSDTPAVAAVQAA